MHAIQLTLDGRPCTKNRIQDVDRAALLSLAVVPVHAIQLLADNGKRRSPRAGGGAAGSSVQVCEVTSNTQTSSSRPVEGQSPCTQIVPLVLLAAMAW